MLFSKNKKNKPQTIDQLYRDSESSYFKGRITEKEFIECIDVIYKEEIQKMEVEQ